MDSIENENIGGVIQTYRQQGYLASLLLFFKIRKIG
jgi:hypothetical protein